MTGDDTRLNSMIGWECSQLRRYISKKRRTVGLKGVWLDDNNLKIETNQSERITVGCFELRSFEGWKRPSWDRISNYLLLLN